MSERGVLAVLEVREPDWLLDDEFESDELEEEMGIRCLNWGLIRGEGQGVLPLLVTGGSDFGFERLEERRPIKKDDGCGMRTLRFGLGRV